jgi:GntR family transcriptional regulator
LVSEGELYREKGKGTFVSKGKIVQRNIMSFSETVRSKGLVPSTIVLHFEKISDRLDIKSLLDIQEDEWLYNIKRLRLASERPFAIEEVFIPERYCPRLETFDLKSSLYRLLKDEYSLTVSYMDNIIEAAKPLKDEKKLLILPDTIPVLRITSTSHDDAGTKLFYERDVYRSDEYNYNARIFLNREV